MRANGLGLQGARWTPDLPLVLRIRDPRQLESRLRTVEAERKAPA